METQTIILVELGICPLGGTFDRYLWTKFVENYHGKLSEIRLL